MSKGIVFIAAGGRGTRLQKEISDFKDTGLPKSLGIVINGKPLIAYQLEHLVPLGYTIVVSFSDQKPIDAFKEYIAQGKIPQYDYLYNFDEFSPDNTTIDILRSSYPHKPWQDAFETIVITSGDIYYDSQYLPEIQRLYERDQCNIQTLCDFEEYMATLEHHFHPIYEHYGTLRIIEENDNLPKEIICHPQFLTERAFRIYEKMLPGTSKSAFVNAALTEGGIFKVVKPKEYVNVNFPADYYKVIKFISNP